MNIKTLPKADRELIIQELAHRLETHPEVSFAYAHGSFVQEGGFRDIDVAVYLAKTPESPLKYELRMEAELMEVTGSCSVDVRVLNSSPLSFRYHVIREGKLLMVRDDDVRADFQEDTIKKYFDFAPYRKMYLEEALGLAV